MPCIMFESNNQVTNVGRIQFWELVLDLFQLFVIQKLHNVITIITK
jgi:hypothetical protein